MTSSDSEYSEYSEYSDDKEAGDAKRRRTTPTRSAASASGSCGYNGSLGVPQKLAFTESPDELETYEEEDLVDLQQIAARATVLEFDQFGRPRQPASLPRDAFDLVGGLAMLKHLPPKIMSDLMLVHESIKQRVGISKMSPWAGLGDDTKRLRAFGFPSEKEYKRLLRPGCPVRLHAPEKTGEEAADDEKANHEAVCVFEGDQSSLAWSTARELVEVIQPARAGLPVDRLDPANGVVYQPNLHNGALHLAAHLDWPLHEGFGKVIVTVGMRGSATILLIGADVDKEMGVQPAWSFHLNEGECYVLSGNARNKCLHAVLADCDCGGGSDEESGKAGGGGSGSRGIRLSARESLNLRFGLHTAEEANMEILCHWKDAL